MKRFHVAAGACLLALAGAAGAGDIAYFTEPIRAGMQKVSAALTPREYRLDAARHIYDAYAGRIMHVDLETGKVLGAMESPGHWIHMSKAGEIFIGSLTGNVFRWYPGWHRMPRCSGSR